MQKRDGLKMLVQFYDNYNNLMQVEKRTGVPVSRLREWLSGGELSDLDRELLTRDIPPEFTGTVKVG